ncbi:MAG: right-handed parallel beta-helix repeat-containing protein, partial [Clostridia bacterium]|nr:right-handed parallel beta-helix repeat-containing protein [Clostridia bacterium]
MKPNLKKLIAILAAAVTVAAGLLVAFLLPPKSITPEFPEEEAKPVKVPFDEGEFKMGEGDLVVSPNGDDNNPGTLDAPIKTVEMAKELLRRRGTADLEKPVTVWLREGRYFIENTVKFTAEDRGNVTYRSYPNEDVSFVGSRAISRWIETTVNGVDALVSDVEINGDEDYFRSLFKNGKRLPRSNYPKTGVFKVADPKTDEAIVPERDARIYTNSAVFYAHKQDVMAFSNPQDVDVRIMHFWCDELLPVHSIDQSTGRVETQKPTEMTLRVDDNYIFENVKEALCNPGEWYLDRSEGKLYYIPEEGETVENTVLYAGKTKKLLTVNGCEGITFSGIGFEQTDWDYVGRTDDTHRTNNKFPSTHHLFNNLKYNATCSQAAFETPAAINVYASKGINFINCLFKNISYSGLKIEGDSENCTVKTSKFEEIGGNAVFIHGDGVYPAATKNIVVSDCRISQYGRIYHNATGIILTHAADCEISHNEVSDGWYTGISIGWTWGYSLNPTNNIKVKDNLIYNIG